MVPWRAGDLQDICQASRREWSLGKTQWPFAPVLLPYQPEISSRERYAGAPRKNRQFLVVPDRQHADVVVGTFDPARVFSAENRLTVPLLRLMLATDDVPHASMLFVMADHQVRADHGGPADSARRADVVPVPPAVLASIRGR